MTTKNWQWLVLAMAFALALEAFILLWESRRASELEERVERLEGAVTLLEVQVWLEEER